MGIFPLIRIILFFLIFFPSFYAWGDSNSSNSSPLEEEQNGTNAGRYRVLQFSNGTTTNNGDGSIFINNAGTIAPSYWSQSGNNIYPTTIGNNVGIGSTIPSQALDVNGTVRSTNFIGAGTGLTGTAGSLNIGGNAATATSAGELSYAGSSLYWTGGGWTTNFPILPVTDNTYTLGTALLNYSTVYGYNFSGNAATATALASTPMTCTSGQGATGINASGTAQGCTTYIKTLSPITLASPNVGIGSTTPGQTLDIQGSLRILGNGNVGIGTTFIGGAGEGALAVMNGNVGIGTWLPSYSLNVAGNAGIGNYLYFVNPPSSSHPGNTAAIFTEVDPNYSSGDSTFITGSTYNGGGRVYFSGIDPTTHAVTSLYSINFSHVSHLEGFPYDIGSMQTSTDATMCPTSGCSDIGNQTADFILVGGAAGGWIANPEAGTLEPGLSFKSFNSDSATFNSSHPEAFTFNTNWPASSMLTTRHTRWQTAGVTKMTLMPGGNLGIGSDSPGQILDVNGTIRTLSFTSQSTTCKTIGPVGTCWTATGQLGYCSGAANICSTCTAC